MNTMSLLEKPSGCEIEQAGVIKVEKKWYQGLGVKIGLFCLIGFTILSLSFNIAMFLWMKNIEKNVILIHQKCFEPSEFQANKDNEDCQELDDQLIQDEGDDDEDDDMVVRILRDSNKGRSKKVKNGKKKKRRGKCNCKDVLGQLQKLKNKRDVSGNVPHLVTHLKGIQQNGAIQSPYNGENIFLWQRPDSSYGLHFWYEFYNDRIVQAIKIRTSGVYEFYAQVTLGGSSASVTNRECGIDLVKEIGGVETTLARSVITQIANYQYGDNTPIKPIDNIPLRGYFRVENGYNVFVRRGCTHADFIVDEELSYFGAQLIK